MLDPPIAAGAFVAWAMRSRITRLSLRFLSSVMPLRNLSTLRSVTFVLSSATVCSLEIIRRDRRRQASARRSRAAQRLSRVTQEFKQPIRIQRRPSLSKEGQRLPHGLDPHTRFLADDQRALVHRHIGEFARVHQNDLVFWNTFEREEVLES